MGWCASLSNKWERSIWMEWIPLRLLWLLDANNKKNEMKSYHVGTCGEVAELGHSSVEQVDVVEKADCCNWIENMLHFYHLHILTCSQSRTYFGILFTLTHSLLLQGYITRKVSTAAPWVVDDDMIKRWLHWSTIENWMMYILWIFV